MNKIKWKSGLVLFIFSLSIPLYMNNKSYTNNFLVENLFSKDYIKSDLFWELLAFLVASIVIVFIYLTALYFTDKRINEKNYNVKWLIRFNLKFGFILYFLANAFSIIYYIICGAHGECILIIPLTEIHALWITPIAVITCSIVPSIIYYILKDKKKLSTFIFGFALSVALIIIFMTFLSVMTCGFNAFHGCLAQKAVKNNNLDICEKAKDKNNCYHYMVKMLKEENIDACRRINTVNLHNSCITNMVSLTNNTQFCDEIILVDEPNKREWTKEWCLRYTY